MSEWKPVKDYEGIYEVSSDGRVRSLDRFDSIGRHRKGIERKQFIVGDGYLQVRLNKDGVTTGKTVHRLVASAFCENADEKPEVNHINCDKLDNRVENLEWVTTKENANHWRDLKRAA